MSYLIDWALVGFVFLGLFTPGPNVILVTYSGATFGFRRTVPHILGIVLGVGIIAGFTGIGVGAVLISFPGLALGFKAIAALWIIWLAWRLWQSNPSSTAEHAKPFTLIEAILFQWVNPKIWALAVAAIAFIDDLPLLSQALALALTFSVSNFFVCTFWTAIGSALANLLNSTKAWRIFTRSMAVILAAFSLLVFL
jgi:threonine/homoserine/homoserine lactone efflux protein